MRNVKAMLLASAAATALVGSAYGADMPTKAPPIYNPAVSGYSWTGFYAGLQGGYEWSSQPWNYTGASGTLGGVLGQNAGGGFLGGQAGFDYQIAPSWVVGGRLDLVYSGLSGTTTLYPGFNISHEIPWHSDVVARAGLLLTPQLLFYGVGGVAFGQIEDGAPTLPFSSSVTLSSITNNIHTGWTGGAGVEYKLTNAWSLGAEWDYFDLGTDGFTYTGSGNTTLLNASDKAAWNSFKGFINLHF